MSNIAAKTSSNAFYQARCKASTHNEQLSSREGAADIMSIDRGRLYRIESGVTNPYPEEIHLMADLYNAPELRNYFCKNCCPLGEDVPEVSTSELDRITIKALSSFKRLGENKRIASRYYRGRYHIRKRKAGNGKGFSGFGRVGGYHTELESLDKEEPVTNGRS